MSPDEIKQLIADAIKEHNHDGVLSAAVNSLDIFQDYKYVMYRIIAPTTANAVANIVGGDWVAPFSGSLYVVGATVDTAGTTGTETIDINVNGTTVLSTKITIDTGEKTSRTAAVKSFISLPNFKEGDIFTFDIDGVHTTPALGLTMFMVVIRTT